MDALIFVDTNILLDFYRIRGGGVGLELLDLIEEHKEILITGSQIEMEYKKNRQKVILEALYAQKTPDWSGLTSPAFLADAKPVRVIAKSKKTITAQQDKLKRRIASILDRPNVNDPVFKCLSHVFKTQGEYNLSRKKKVRFTIRHLARKRFALGYPPRKPNDTSIGDAVNWEWITHCAKTSGKDIIIVTRDSDYGCNYDGKFHLNDWLRLEFKERISRKRRIVLTDRLAEAFKLVAVPVSPQAEAEEKQLVAERSVPTNVKCSQCGTSLEEPASLPLQSRKPCPSCGSKSRTIEVSVHDSISVNVFD
jgi:Zn finger protein HypA/HybF involved in hydrogenase expression